MEPGFKFPAQKSLDHQSQLIALVGPTLIELTGALVVPSEAADLRLAELELAAVVEVLTVAGEVVYETQGPAHEVHHVLRVPR